MDKLQLSKWRQQRRNKRLKRRFRNNFSSLAYEDATNLEVAPNTPKSVILYGKVDGKGNSEDSTTASTLKERKRIMLYEVTNPDKDNYEMLCKD